MGMRLHDVNIDPVDASNNYDEKRLVYDIVWESSRPRGYYAITGVIKENGKVDKSLEAKQKYIINESFHPLITQIMNPGLSLIDE